MIGVNQNNNSHPYGGSTTVTARQAWAILSRHARDEIAPLRLQELCHDKDRVSSLVEVYSGDVDSNRILIVDLSRQLLTDTTLNHLLNLATAVELKRFIRQIAWGPNNPEKPVRPVNNAKHSKQPIQMPMFDKTRIAHFRQPKIDATLSHDTVDTLASQQHQQRPHSETIPSMHLALRVPAYKGYEILDQTGVNVLTGIHQEWHRMERYSESVRLGQLKGAGGHMIRDVVVVGQGVAVSALKFIYTALLKDEQAVMASRFGLSQHDYYSQLNNSNNRIRLGNLTGALTATFSTVKVGRRMKFLSTVDPIAAASVVADLDPATTLIVSIALIGTEETGLATTTLKNWLLQGLSRSIMSNTSNSKMVDSVLAKHMILVTGSDRLAATTHKPESVYVIPEHARCEAFTAYTVATLLPLSVVFGWSIVEELLAGAHDMDVHFVETNPRHNLPVLLALMDVWNDTFLNASARAVTPFTEAFAAFPAFAGALDSQTCSLASSDSQLSANGGKKYCSSTVLDCGSDGSYDRAFYQSNKIVNSELIMTMDSQMSFNVSRTLPNGDNIHAAQDALMSSFFAHADELAFGKSVVTDNILVNSPDALSSLSSHKNQNSGNRPSVLLMIGKLDAFSCGQFIALSEHRAVVKAHTWGIDPFVREVGSSLRIDRTDELRSELAKLFTAQEGDDDDDDEDEPPMILSTKTMLGHYANLVKGERMFTVQGEHKK